MSKIKDIGFGLNYQHLVEMDITPKGDKRTFARVGAGISSFGDNTADEVDETAYMDSDGGTDKSVTGGTYGWAPSGHRLYGDPFQDYVASLKYTRGSDRTSTLRVTNPDGETVEGTCSITDIVGAGPNGDANSKSEFSCNLNFIGTPYYTPPTAETLPAAVEASDVEVTVGSSVKVGEAVTPDDCSKRCVYAMEDWSVATVDSEGNVTGLKAGNTRMTVKAAAKPSVAKMIEVTVKEATAETQTARQASPAKATAASSDR